ncbi:MAG: transposase, partial [Nostocaceae cyanobacterium]|nr:transposase [Nostocaceae cyanobacterium]
GKENGLVPAPRFLRQTEHKIKHLSKGKRRKRSPNFKKKIKASYELGRDGNRHRPVRASRRWKQVQKRISKLTRKVANQRQNFVHQETTRIISGNSTVVTEKLEVKNISAKANKGKRKKQKAGLNKSILDVGMGMINDALKAKLADIDGLFVEVPTPKVKPSQTCPKCGYQEKKSLDQRTHVCNNCEYTQQRDIASAEVMLLWHLNLLGLGTSLKDVDDFSSTSSTSKRKQAGSMKQLGRAKRQKSTLHGLDVETSPSTK